MDTKESQLHEDIYNTRTETRNAVKYYCTLSRHCDMSSGGSTQNTPNYTSYFLALQRRTKLYTHTLTDSIDGVCLECAKMLKLYMRSASTRILRFYERVRYILVIFVGHP